MIGLDTNVLARYLTQDDPKQSAQATSLIENAIKVEDTLFVNQIVLCELNWVLGRAYGFAKQELVDVFEKMLQARQFEIEDKPTVLTAFTEFKTSKADFADCLINVKNRKAGCRATFSFDQAALGLNGFSSAAAGFNKK